MFALRVIFETRENTESPFSQEIETYELGKSYSVLKRNNTRLFPDAIKRYMDFDDNSVRAIVSGDNGTEWFILNNSELVNANYYIMTDSGSTFEKL